jgi:hypothetical protein
MNGVVAHEPEDRIHSQKFPYDLEAILEAWRTDALRGLEPGFTSLATPLSES